jgi:hypothetical protein
MAYLVGIEHRLPSKGKLAIDYDFPGQAEWSQFGKERIGIELLHVPYSPFLPNPSCNKTGPKSGRNSGGIGDSLGFGILIRHLMAAVIEDEEGTFLSILDTPDLASYGSLALIVRSQEEGSGSTALRNCNGWISIPW